MNRYRNEDNRYAHTWTNTGQACGNPAPNVWSSSGEIISALGTYRTMRDNVIPNYHARSARGELFFNSYNQMLKVRTLTTSTGRWSKACGVCCPGLDTWVVMDGCFPFYQGKGFLLHAPVPLDIGQLITLAGTEAQADIDSPEFQGLVFVAELSEALQLLTNPLGSLTKLLRKYQRSARRAKRSKRTHASNLLEFIEENWLVYRYGISPILHDAHDVVKAIDSLRIKKPLRQTARGSAENYGDAEQQDLYAAAQTDGYRCWDYSRDISTHRRVMVRAGAMYEVDIRDTFGVASQNIPLAIWERIPFSFMADWAVNMNSYIGAITPKMGVTILGTWTVVDDLTTSTGNVTTTFNPGTANSDWSESSSPSATETYVTRRKSRYPGLTVGLASEPIPFKGNLGIKRVIDGIAIIDGLLNSKLKPFT